MTAPSATGTVVQLNRKSEVPGERGLPKVSVAMARVTSGGVEGDFNRYRREEKRDDPGMALLLLPLEVIEELNREGWPVRAGDLGENVTTRGIPNDEFRPSRRVRVGPVLVEVSKPCDPCDNLFLLPYVGKARGPAFLRTTLGRRGWYCRVVEEGTLHPGDRIRFESP
jgi:MOSC domain-containing protein YiiM